MSAETFTVEWGAQGLSGRKRSFWSEYQRNWPFWWAPSTVMAFSTAALLVTGSEKVNSGTCHTP